MPGWFRTWKRERFSVTAEHLPVWQPEWGRERDRQPLPPTSKKAQDPQKEVKRSQLAAKRKRSPVLWLFWGSLLLLRVRGTMEQDRRDNPTEWQKRRNDHCLPSKLHSHHSLQCSLFPLRSPAGLEWSMVNCLKSSEGHQVSDGNCLVYFAFFSLSERFAFRRGEVLAAQCFPAGSTEHKGIIHFWLSRRLEEKLL